jgi:hypothetical protein
MNPNFDEFAAETLAKLENPGCLLVGAKKNGKCNVMAIGWGFVGVFWRMPVFLVAVGIRGSRMSLLKIVTSLRLTCLVKDWKRL